MLVVKLGAGEPVQLPIRRELFLVVDAFEQAVLQHPLAYVHGRMPVSSYPLLD